MKKTIITLAAATLALSSANAQNLILNGDFEANTGAPANWTVGGAITPPAVFPNSGVVPAAGGIGNALDLGPAGPVTSGGGFAEQTISVAAGSYLFSFQYTGETSSGAGTFDFDLTGASALSDSFNTTTSFTTYTAAVNVATAGNLTFRFTDTSTVPINAVIDNVSFVATPVPEPSSALLLGLSALGFFGRRKRS